MSSLLKSLRKNAEMKFIKSSKEHMRKSMECVMTLESAFKKVKQGDFKTGKEKLRASDELENQADQIRRSILIELPTSELSNRVREALAHLIKNIDRIANTANGAARIFIQVPDHYFDVICDDEGTIMKMLGASVESVKLLIRMVDDLLDKGKELDKIHQEIQKIEHDVDVLLAKKYEMLMNIEKQVPPFVAIQISKGVNYIEAISDSVEDTADYIKVIAIES